MESPYLCALEWDILLSRCTWENRCWCLWSLNGIVYTLRVVMIAMRLRCALWMGLGLCRRLPHWNSHSIALYIKKVAACELHAAAIPAIIAVGSHIIAQKPRDARAHHVSAIAAIIAVGSHTIAQSDIRTSFSKENSEYHSHRDIRSQSFNGV